MTKLIDQLLFLAKYDSGKVLPDETNIDIRKILEDTFNRLDPILSEKEIKINIIANGDTSAVADESMMGIIFENVITNSIKYSSNRSEIEALFNNYDSYLECIIKDTGAGMTDEQTHC